MLWAPVRRLGHDVTASCDGRVKSCALGHQPTTLFDAANNRSATNVFLAQVIVQDPQQYQHHQQMQQQQRAQFQNHHQGNGC